MNVVVTHKLNSTGNITLKARVETSSETFMNAIYLRKTGELYVAAYQVEESLRGRYCSVMLFSEVIAAATTSCGEVDVVRGSGACVKRSSTDGPGWQSR